VANGKHIPREKKEKEQNLDFLVVSVRAVYAEIINYLINDIYE
jgi:hypothetical protein